MFYFVLFVSIPILEIYLFLKVSEYVGSLETVILIILTALVGSILIKRKGAKIFNHIKMVALKDPEQLARALGDGLFVIISGILLLTPGFITDLLGITLFFRKPRDFVLNFLFKRITPSTNSKFKHDR